MQTGYVHCACGGCFDDAMSDEDGGPDLCSLCEAAGCDRGGECQREDADSDDWEAT